MKKIATVIVVEPFFNQNSQRNRSQFWNLIQYKSIKKMSDPMQQILISQA